MTVAAASQAASYAPSRSGKTSSKTNREKRARQPRDTPASGGGTAGRVLATPAKETRSARPRRDGGARVGPRLQGDRAFGPGGQPCTHVAVAALAPGRRLQQDPKTAHWKEGIAER
jgi:hypothetical protein